MTATKTVANYSPEVRERAVRLVLDGAGEHGSQWAAINSIAAKIGCTAETLRRWVRQVERDRGKRAGPTTVNRLGNGALSLVAW
jgi:transposase-like protein